MPAPRLPLNPSVPVGDQLKTRRQALKLSLAQIELETKIRGKYLIALEACDYDALPNDVYGRGFVQHYANHLGMNGQLVAAAYIAERGEIKDAPTARPKLQQSRRLVFTGPLVAALAGLLVIIVVIGYLGWQFSSLASAPHLVVTSPDSDRTLTGGAIDVAGTTTPGTDVSLNGTPVLVGTDGSFRQTVALQSGLNSLHVTSTSKLGKTSTVTRTIRAKIPAVTGSVASLPTAPIAGVEIAVTVTKTTALVVTADGNTLFSGTVLAGRQQLFGGVGTGTIMLTTGDAGATNVSVTNSVAAGKKLYPLGTSGEIRRNQEFDQATVIP